MFSYPFAQAIAVAIILTAGFAAWKGDRAERWGGLMNLAALVLVWTIHNIRALVDIGDPATLLLVADGALALGFLLLAIRYASFWIGGAMILQAVQFSLHAYYLIGEVPHDRFYSRVNNIDTIGILVVIISGAALAWRKRERLAREDAAKAEAHALALAQTHAKESP